MKAGVEKAALFYESKINYSYAYTCTVTPYSLRVTNASLKSVYVAEYTIRHLVLRCKHASIGDDVEQGKRGQSALRVRLTANSLAIPLFHYPLASYKRYCSLSNAN